MRSLLFTLGSALTLLTATCRNVTGAKGIEPGMANHSPISMAPSERDGRSGGAGGAATITPFVAR